MLKDFLVFSSPPQNGISRGQDASCLNLAVSTFQPLDLQDYLVLSLKFIDRNPISVIDFKLCNQSYEVDHLMGRVYFPRGIWGNNYSYYNYSYLVGV